MVTFCAVVNCGSRSGRDPVRFFRFPAVRNFAHKQDLNELSRIRRARWLDAINRADLTEQKIKYGHVCSKHFVTGQPAKLEEESSIDWVPSINMGYGGNSDNSSNIIRKGRKKLRVAYKTEETEDVSAYDPPNKCLKQTSTRPVSADLSPQTNPISSSPSIDDVLSKLNEVMRQNPTNSEDSCDIFGRQVAAKLKTLSKDSRLFTEKLISDLLFEAEMGNIDRSAKIVVFVKKPKQSVGSKMVETLIE